MKILIDTDVLEKEGAFTDAQIALLTRHGMRDTGSTAINMLLAFGALTIAAGAIALFAQEGVIALFGVGFILLGQFVAKRYPPWNKLASIWMVVGALALAGGFGTVLRVPPVVSSLCVALIWGWVGVIADSTLLMALVPFSLAAAIGGTQLSEYGSYLRIISEPTLMIGLFSALAWAGWRIAKRLEGSHQRLALVFSRVCVILANLGFWAGSLLGDTPGQSWNNPQGPFLNQMSHPAQIAPWVFGICWAVALLLIGIWGARNGRRFIVNTAAAFGAIHFYTQWFDYSGAYPGTLMAAGFVTILIGLALWRYNRRVLAPSAP